MITVRKCGPLRHLGIRGIKSWLFKPRDIYIHRILGKVTLMSVQGRKAIVHCGDRITTVVLPVFRRGVKCQLREGRRPSTTNLNNGWMKYREKKVIRLKGLRLVLSIERVARNSALG